MNRKSNDIGHNYHEVQSQGRFEDQLIDALRKFDNSNSISWQILSLGDGGMQL